MAGHFFGALGTTPEEESLYEQFLVFTLCILYSSQVDQEHVEALLGNIILDSIERHSMAVSATLSKLRT